VARRTSITEGPERVGANHQDLYGLSLACREGHLDVVDYLLSRTENIPLMEFNSPPLPWGGIHVPFYWAGTVPVLNRLLAVEGEHRVTNKQDLFNHAFIDACGRGNLPLMRRLLELEGDLWTDVHDTGEDVSPEYALREACTYGQLAAVNLLLELKGDRRIDVHAADDEAFRLACGMRPDWWPEDFRGGDSQDIANRLLALVGERTIPWRAITVPRWRDVARAPFRMMIAHWREGRVRRRAEMKPRKGGAWLRALEGLPRAGLAEVMRQVGRPL
jgi:hypothetical protein